MRYRISQHGRKWEVTRRYGNAIFIIGFRTTHALAVVAMMEDYRSRRNQVAEAIAVGMYDAVPEHIRAGVSV